MRTQINDILITLVATAQTDNVRCSAIDISGEGCEFSRVVEVVILRNLTSSCRGLASILVF